MLPILLSQVVGEGDAGISQEAEYVRLLFIRYLFVNCREWEITCIAATALYN
jgi:hypothetical protein